MSAGRPAGDREPPGDREAAAGSGAAAGPGSAAAAGPAAGSEPVTITVCPDGPLLVRGGYELLDGDDRPIDPGRATVALCRCGASAIKPFCDGSHKRARFRAR
ncbi:hypothetical protein GCM10011374_31860 [Kocuria dechangensis]|uniref:Iron-binding zinc finger CDGSH type domain-containing protein n=1 Tax=Kocuria dechangensis TaxID=1176249 RepID=A0A917LYJ2_9MICC|nr:CDGSH iron-sulfur domain-containing protein [Kocuria dechangensis]GGG65586.1 hypothetical protein GCM10011374_31860 [Kocuria dechangensis]